MLARARSSSRSTLSRFAIACLAVSLAACGGSSDGASDAAPPSIDAAVTIDAPTPVADAAAVDAVPCPIPLDEMITAQLAVTADDYTRIHVNGVLVNEDASLWFSPRLVEIELYRNPTRTNVIAIEAWNAQNAGGLDRGLVADVRWTPTVGGATTTLVTDAAWKISPDLVTGWETTAYDDTGWVVPVLEGAMGVSPYGDVFATIAPGSSADWVWLYDAALASDKPVEEYMYARRSFSIDVAGAVSNAPATCP